EAGKGPVLVHLHGAGGLRLSPAHDLLAKQFRVIAFEMPGFGASAENTRTQSMPELAGTMAAAADKLGLDRFNLMGTSFGGKTALWLAVQSPERVLALVLESPAALRPDDPARDGASLQGADPELPPRLCLRRRPRGRRRTARGLCRGGGRFPRTPRSVHHQPHRDGDPPIGAGPRAKSVQVEAPSAR